MEKERKLLPVFSLEEQISRANQAAKSIEAGYYLTDEELDDTTLVQTPFRPDSFKDKEWI
jgi:hypothetical protein